MAMANNNREPSTAPHPDKWYDLTLGSSFKDHSSTKFCTLRYEFKPASIDKNQPGSLHKNKDNRVTVEFHNNQPGKPKVTFDGSSEDYKDNDGVLFFDGHTFRLERLHRAVKRLRHVRLPGESVASASIAGAAPLGVMAAESRSPGPSFSKTAKLAPVNKTVLHSVPVEVERIDIGESESPGAKPTGRSTDCLTVPPTISTISPEPKNYETDENIDIIADEDEGKVGKNANLSFDINISSQNELGRNHDTDDEIADVDVSDDEVDKGPNAAEALRAQVNAEEREGQTSSSSGSSGSGSSGSGSGSASSSSDSEGSDDDSASSGADSQKFEVRPLSLASFSATPEYDSRKDTVKPR